MKVLFFPQDQKFWLDHGLFMFFLLATQMVITIPFHSFVAALLFADLFWLPLFTLAVLLFRYMFKTLQWDLLSSRQFVEYGLVFSLLGGLAISLIMSAIVSSFFWPEFTSNLIPQRDENFSVPLLVFGSIMGNWIQTTIFISAWLFLYNSITSTKRIRETELLYLRSQHNLKEAMLNSLSNQLNPHFLFNTLNNIRFMIRENQKSAEHMVVSLSEILRYSLESSRQEKVSVTEEVAIIHRYIAIVKSQLEDRLNFQLNIAQEHHHYLIPPMVLQMLIENGIKHGIDNILKGGELQVCSQDEGQGIQFIVSNDLPDKTAITTPTTKIGLKNIRKRLELLYGDQSSLNIVKTQNKFTVILKIPKEVSQ
jgi:LytS/YehU family sensor histidine kinase